MFGDRNMKDGQLEKTPSKPKRVSVPSDSNKFSLRQIMSKKMSVSMPELLNESVVTTHHESWRNGMESSTKNSSVESLQVCIIKLT